MTNAQLLGEIDLYLRLVWVFCAIIFAFSLMFAGFFAVMERDRRRMEEKDEFSRLILKAREEERREIACALHDTLLSELRLLIRSDGTAADGETVIRQHETLSRFVREISASLMPPDFDRLSFKDAVYSLVQMYSRRVSLEWTLKIDEELRTGELDTESLFHIYRILSESIVNIEKHSRSSRVIIVVRNENNAGAGQTLLVCVSDDGAGLAGADGKQPNSGGKDSGLGMKTMRLRAAALNARLDFINEPDNGLMVRLEVPLFTSPPPPPR
jgi:signal transduction histidine kinase